MYSTINTRRGGPARGSHRATGGEWRALAWLCRHPLFLLVPAAVTAVVVWLGPWPVVWTVAGATVDLVVWARVQPPSFDRWAAPWLRQHWRRWTVYRGRRWAAVLIDCDLVRDNRRTGQLLIPRVLRVRSATRSIDTLYVRMARGQDLHVWTEKADALAAALFARRVAITKVRPAVLAIVVEREMPFDRVIPAPDIPGDPREVDLTALDVGDDEHGNPLTVGVVGKHVFVAGASGAGKGSLLWAPLRAIGPMIPVGLVHLTMIDLKGGAETERGRPLFYRYATTMGQAIDVLTQVRDVMKARKAGRGRLRDPGRGARGQPGTARSWRPGRTRDCGPVAGAVCTGTVRGRCRRSHRRRLARHPPAHRAESAQAGGGVVMWAVTGWAVVTWLKITIALAIGVGAAWLWCSPGWFVVCVVVAVLVELWAIRQLAKEWAYEARSSWWWSP